MPPTITSEKITLSYPLFCADFVDVDRLLVAGGGGEGRSGVGNRITLLDVSKSSTKSSDTETLIKVISEHELSKEEDAVMSLSVSTATASSSSKPKKKSVAGGPGALALTGVNSSKEARVSGKNQHFRTFTVGSDSICPLEKLQLFTPASSIEIYQRLLRTSSSGRLAAVVSGEGLTTASSEIVVVEVPGMNTRRRLIPEGKKVEVGDLDISDETLVYCTSTEIFTMSPTGKEDKPKKVQWQPTPPLKGTLRCIRILSPTLVTAVLNHPQRSGSELLLINIASTGPTLLSRKTLHKSIRAVTGMDCISLGQQAIIAVAGADQSIELLAVNNHQTHQKAGFKSIKTFRDVHPFQITKVAFSRPPPPSLPTSSATSSPSDEDKKVIRLATTSMGNTVVVFTLPLIISSSGQYTLLHSKAIAKATFFSVTLSLLGVIIFAIFLQLMFDARSGLSHTPSFVAKSWDDARERISQVLGTWSMDGGGGFLKGVEAGAASNPFEDGFVSPRNYEGVDKQEEVEGRRGGGGGGRGLTGEIIEEMVDAAGEWLVDEARQVGAGVLKGMIREGVQGFVG